MSATHYPGHSGLLRIPRLGGLTCHCRCATTAGVVYASMPNVFHDDGRDIALEPNQRPGERHDIQLLRAPSGYIGECGHD
jgi:hypothetical protein